MKNYLNQLDTKILLPITVEVEPIGRPNVDIIINDNLIEYKKLTQKTSITEFCKLLDNIEISIILTDKHYTIEYETAVIIRLFVDGIDIIPTYNHLIEYQNDHNVDVKSNYLGFNGKWTLTINRPFYQWLHQAQNQGWLLD